ncbi:hypothetical protein Tsubulata_011829 [Turnera subulata]|uniref:Bifunctional inhibitor/plant lipid transfer protein/seed storage helical domain-containing protein n=1 Tax=Turnera subulata TaxID=218843 RepID=A0A9Q0J5J7_9ROSI|nr:hypothetical protein Tsubulata_011829 [Turnera subulata]
MQLQMERIKIHKLTLFIASLLLVPNNVNSQQTQRPLCASQLALVNWACSRVRFPPPAAFPSPIHFPFPEQYEDEASTMALPATDEPGHGHEHEHGRGHGHGHGQGHGHGHGNEHGQGHGHGNEHGNGHEHGHGHGHGHRHRKSHGSGHGHGQGFHEGGVGYSESPEERNCCRWLKDVDDECVCELLVHLPSFLARPLHEYSVVADPTCNVTFSCVGGGPV